MSAAMLYIAAIGALLGSVALVTERIVAQFGWSHRGIWMLSLTASLSSSTLRFFCASASTLTFGTLSGFGEEATRLESSIRFAELVPGIIAVRDSNPGGSTSCVKRPGVGPSASEE